MEVLILGGIGLIAATIAVADLMRRTNRRARSSKAQQAVNALGFRWNTLATRARGTLDGVKFEVALEEVDDDGVPIAVALVVQTIEPQPCPDFVFAPESVLRGLGLTRGVDIEVGEGRFDEAVKVRAADEARVVSILDAPTRDAIGGAVMAGARLWDGLWTARYSTEAAQSPVQLASNLKVIARAHDAVARGLERSAIDGLAAIANKDRSTSVRMKALAMLWHRGLADADLLAEASRDPNQEIRFAAARALGAAGHDTLVSLMRTGSRTWRMRAAASLAQPPVDPALLPVVEETLVSSLPHDDLIEPACAALARVGTARSVQGLKQAAEQGPHKVAARRTLAAVRARLEPGTAGRLTLSEDIRGELSMAMEDGGMSDTDG